jgi:5-methylcytosine-specific restriction protein B
MEKSNQFTWIKTYKELVEYLKNMKDRQKELISILEEVLGEKPKEKEKDKGLEFELEEIDPFTFISYLNKFGQAKRLQIIQNLAKKLNLTVPVDIDGVPSTNPQNVWWFPVKSERTNNEIEKLWNFFYLAVENKITDEAFSEILHMKGIGICKLTDGLYLINPESYLCLDDPVTDYLKDKYSLTIKVDKNTTYQDYLRILEEVRKYTDLPFYVISDEAWNYHKDKKKKDETVEKREPESETNIINTSFPLNQILYGPPGTGKTYNAINYAIQITRQIKPQNEIERRKIFNELLEEGRVVFTTFHQSVSYEYFIEGIKPVTHKEQNIAISYEVLPGIFKTLCDRATLPDGVGFEKAYKSLLNDLKQGPINISSDNKTNYRIVLNLDNELYIYPKENQEKGYTIPKDTLISYILNRNIPENLTTFCKVIKKQLKSYGWNDKSTKKDNYVLIIDEINRGNIAQIFGELITLIEANKRKGEIEELEVILPYSKTSFSVPSNLYIIGTMNTTDRNVEALDTALRRRFSFIEMEPEYDKFINENIEDINLEKLLRVINDRIIGLMDKDHCIGHSYFMNVENLQDLKLVFFNKIIPLLQEYFYGRYEKIGLILSPKFLNPIEYKESKYSKLDFPYEEDLEHTVYLIKSENEVPDEEFKEALKEIMTS